MTSLFTTLQPPDVLMSDVCRDNSTILAHLGCVVGVTGTAALPWARLWAAAELLHKPERRPLRCCLNLAQELTQPQLGHSHNAVIRHCCTWLHWFCCLCSRCCASCFAFQCCCCQRLAWCCFWCSLHARPVHRFAWLLRRLLLLLRQVATSLGLHFLTQVHYG